MQILNLSIKNFRGVKSLVLDDLPEAVFLTGMNGSGKSTVLDAIRVVLIGRCFNARGKRIENADIVGPWGKQAIVKATVRIGEEDLVITQIVTSRSAQLDVSKTTGQPRFGGSAKEIRQAFWQLAGVDPRHAECAMNPLAYLLGDDLGALLADMQGAAVTADHVLNYAAISGAAEWLAEAVVTGDPSAQVDIAALGQWAYDRRTVVNRDIKQAEAELAKQEGLEPPESPQKGTLGPDDLPVVDAQIAELRGRLERLLRQAGAAKAGRTHDAITADLERIRPTYDASMSAYEDIRKQVEAAQARARDLDQQTQGLLARRSELTGDLAQANAALSTARRNLEKLDGKVCPQCGRAWTKKQLEARRAEVGQEVATAEASAEAINLKIQNVDAQKESDSSGQAEAHRSVQALQGKEGEASTKMRTLFEQVRALENEAPVDPMTADSEPETEIAEVRRRIERGEQIAQTLQDLAYRTATEEQLSVLRTEKDHLDWAVTAFRDGAYQNEVLVGSDALEQWLARCNEKMDPFGYQISINVEGKTVTPLMHRGNGAAVPASQVSDGERLLAQRMVATR